MQYEPCWFGSCTQPGVCRQSFAQLARMWGLGGTGGKVGVTGGWVGGRVGGFGGSVGEFAPQPTGVCCGQPRSLGAKQTRVLAASTK